VRAILLPAYDVEHSVFDLNAILSFIGTHWLAIGVCAILGGSAAVAVSFAFDKVYRAEVLLAPSNVGGDLSGGIQSLIGKYSSLASAVGVGMPGQGGLTPIAIARLKSRSFVEAFITEQKVMAVLYPEEQPGSQPGAGDPNAPTHTLQDGYQLFIGKIMLIRQDKAADLVTIRIDWTNRELAAAWANELVSRLNSVMRADAIEETERSLKYLQTELQRAEYVTLKNSISSLMENQINKRMLAVTQPDYAFRVVDPAKPSDPNKKVFPKRSVFLVLGFALGSFVGALISLRRRGKAKATKPAAPAR